MEKNIKNGDNNICETLNIGPDCKENVLPMSIPELAILSKRGIRFSGHSYLKKMYEIRRKTNFAHLLLYTLGGSGWLRSDGIETVLKTGDLWISPDGTGQEYGIEGDFWEILWFDLYNVPPWMMIEKLGSCVRKGYLGLQLANVVNGIIQEVQLQAFFKQKVIDLLADVILLYLEREFELVNFEKNFDIMDKLHRLYEKVQKSLQNDWEVDNLARESKLFVSPHHFSRLCVEYLGISPMRLVTKLRMERARELIHNTDYPLEKVSGLVGYNDYFAFSTAFKRWHGVSPRGFRQMK